MLFALCMLHAPHSALHSFTRPRPFPSTQQVPPFLVGRIQWDQWLLLKHIVDMDVTTIEVCIGVRVGVRVGVLVCVLLCCCMCVCVIERSCHRCGSRHMVVHVALHFAVSPQLSHATVGLHIGHGAFKESHGREGTWYNVQLSQHLPHPRVHPQNHVQLKGTVWLGRLDEVEVVAVPCAALEAAMLQSRVAREGGGNLAAKEDGGGGCGAIADTLHANVVAEHPDFLRIPQTYFEGQVQWRWQC